SGVGRPSMKWPGVTKGRRASVQKGRDMEKVMMHFSRWVMLPTLMVALVNATGGCTLVGTVIGAAIPDRKVTHSTDVRPSGRAAAPPTWPAEGQKIEMRLSDGDLLKGSFEGAENGFIKVDAAGEQSLAFPLSRVDSISWTTREGSYVGTGFAVGLFLDIVA